MNKMGVCALCKHVNGPMSCKAFPNGIPEEFLLGDKLHFTSTGDDNGITFEPRSERTEYLAKQLGYKAKNGV